MSPDHCEGGFPSTAGWLIPPSCCRLEEDRSQVKREMDPNGKRGAKIRSIGLARKIPEVQGQLRAMDQEVQKTRGFLG